VLILAGGFGTRLWPSSREHTPKHLLPLAGENSLLRETYLRVAPIVAPEQVYVATAASHADQVRAQLPELPHENIIVEPVGKGTAPCIGLAALQMKRRNPEGVMASLHADHVILNPEGFRAALKSAAVLAEKGYIATLGITPRWAETGFGYIEAGQPLEDTGVAGAYRAIRFTEKPDAETARKFVTSGRFFWNSGIFVWRIARILEDIRVLLPELHSALAEIDRAAGTLDAQAVLERVWPQIRSVTIDVGIMEKAQGVAVIPISVGWNDVGSWKAVADVMTADVDGNTVVGEHLGLDTTGTLVLGGKRLIATIGLKDMVIVDTGDVVLVCPKDRAQDVKMLVEQLRSQNRKQYL
jgi:mannose-1-phosphate guanylyltransferase